MLQRAIRHPFRNIYFDRFMRQSHGNIATFPNRCKANKFPKSDAPHLSFSIGHKGKNQFINRSLTFGGNGCRNRIGGPLQEKTSITFSSVIGIPASQTDSFAVQADTGVNRHSAAWEGRIGFFRMIFDSFGRQTAKLTVDEVQKGESRNRDLEQNRNRPGVFRSRWSLLFRPNSSRATPDSL